jgi:starvation-inducible outer membrane lipoprotein
MKFDRQKAVRMSVKHRSHPQVETKLLAFALCALLTGCASTPKPEAVNIPVVVGCVGELPARPVNTFGAGAYPGGKGAAQVALVDSAAWEGYATKLEVVIAGCPAKQP